MTDHTSPCHMLWDLAGRPAPTDPPRGAGQCALCGEHGPLHAELGVNFTDYRKLANISGTRLCAACSWTTGGRPPNSLRMWSVVARTDVPAPPSNPAAHANGKHLHLTNRKDLRWVASTLADPPPDYSPWLVAVAESGKKHCAPFTAINRGHNWRVHLDGCDITSNADEWRTMLTHTVALRGANFSAGEIETGQPPVVKLDPTGLRAWTTHYQPLEPHRNTPLLHLANLAITKETLGDYLRAYPTN